VIDPDSYESLEAQIDATTLEIGKVDTDLQTAQTEVNRLRKLFEQLRTEQDALEGRMHRLYPDQESAEAADEPVQVFVNWQTLTRTDAVFKAIEELSASQSAASPGDIESLLRTRGRNDDRDQIGGATAHLNRNERIHSVGRAQWAIGPEDKAVEASG
jgi:chromosome segregation ATPase